MKSKIFYCDVCNAPMIMVKKLSNYTKIRQIFRRRRFKCSVCDYEKVIYADGFRDEIGEGIQAIEKINKNFKQEEENRKS